jgi:hypothetical protein
MEPTFGDIVYKRWTAVGGLELICGDWPLIEEAIGRRNPFLFFLCDGRRANAHIIPLVLNSLDN